MLYALSVGLVVVVWLAIVVLNEKAGLLSCDRFPNAAAKWFAYAWLLLFLVLLAVLITQSAQAPPTPAQLQRAPFYSVFSLHLVLVVFLAGWWLASGRPALREFLNIRHERPAEVIAIGVSAGVGGWIFTLGAALIFALLLKGVGLMPENVQPPPAFGWMAALPLWKKGLIVLSAMTVEEAFFRSFLQKRVGLLVSTILFALAHFTYGQPLLLVGVTLISLVIAVTFHRTKNVIPGVIAHGVFDSIQLFVIVPIAFRMMGGA